MKRTLKWLAFSASILTALFTSACSSSPLPISVALTSSASQTDQGKSVTITANLTNDTQNRGVYWSLQGPGTISGETATAVTYTSPDSVLNQESATIGAASVAQSSATASTQITVNPPPTFSAPGQLPSGDTGTAYNQGIELSGGTPPFQWSVTSGALPPGLSLASGAGEISGTPTGGGTWYFNANVTDAAGLSAVDPMASIEIYSNAPPGHPVPFLEQPLVPDSATPGGAGFTLTANGAGFVSGATMDFNGKPLTTTFVSGERLTATVPASDIAAAGTATITVVNPTPGGGSSNAAYFPVATPESTPVFTEALGSPIAIDATSVLVDDFNGDGKPDLALAQQDQMEILLGKGDGTFVQALSSPFVNPVGSDSLCCIATGDFNNSGNAGLAVAATQDEIVKAMLGSATGALTASSTMAQAGGIPTVGLVAGDFNGDGNLDLAVANALSGETFEVLLGYGDGAFNPAPNNLSGASPTVTPYPVQTIVAGDFNGDGKLDLALGGWSTTNTASGAVSVLLGNGVGAFTAAPGSPFTAGSIPYAIVAADFNGDGKLDLAVANENDNTVTILLGNGDGTFTQAPGSPIAVGNGPDALAVGDFIGNGKLDLAVANGGSGTLTILLGNGDGTFTEAAGSPFAVGKGPTSIAVGDFNGSGRLGLAVTNLLDGTTSILVQQ